MAREASEQQGGAWAGDCSDKSSGGSSDEGEDSDVPALGEPRDLVRAAAVLGGGVALCAVFSDPLVESLTNLSR
jgi:hypothetical protein